jgi:hypothetical protein
MSDETAKAKQDETDAAAAAAAQAEAATTEDASPQDDGARAEAEIADARSRAQQLRLVEALLFAAPGLVDQKEIARGGAARDARGAVCRAWREPRARRGQGRPQDRA